MWSENSDEEIYVTQSTIRQKWTLGDVNDWFQDGLPSDGQVVTNNMGEKATTETCKPLCKDKPLCKANFRGSNSS